MPRPSHRRPARGAFGLLCGAAATAGFAGCGATGANLAESPAAGKPAWYSPSRLLAAADPARAMGLSPDDVLPATRDDLKNPAALDLAYANLRTASGPGGADAAEDAYRRVLADDPDNVEALIGLARLIERNAEDRPNELADAQDAYERAVAAVPGDARPYNALGRFHADRGRWGDSAAAYGKAVAAATSTRLSREAHFGLAVATARGGDLAAARPHFVAAVGEASAHYNVGTLLLRAGDRDAAEAEFRRAVAKGPGDEPGDEKGARRPRRPHRRPGRRASGGDLPGPRPPGRRHPPSPGVPRRGRTSPPRPRSPRPSPPPTRPRPQPAPPRRSPPRPPSPRSPRPRPRRGRPTMKTRRREPRSRRRGRSESGRVADAQARRFRRRRTAMPPREARPTIANVAGSRHRGGGEGLARVDDAVGAGQRTVPGEVGVVRRRCPEVAGTGRPPGAAALGDADVDRGQAGGGSFRSGQRSLVGEELRDPAADGDGRRRR